MNERRNPILDLPAGRRLEELPLEARRALRDVLLELADQANEQAETAWSRRKGPMAVYWRAVSTYAKHIARATLRAGIVDPVRLGILRAAGVAIDQAEEIASQAPLPAEWTETELRLASGDR